MAPHSRSALGPSRDARILVIGATGFIGSAIARRLAAGGWRATHLTRHAHTGVDAGVVGDLLDMDSLRRACEKHDVVINAASYVGPDLRRQHEINALGAANLARAFAETGGTRLVYISSTSVYGGQVPNGSHERTIGFTPRSTLGESRFAAENFTANVGGVILRPHLVYGPGDKFFITPLVQAMQALGGWIEHGSARISAISSDSLARAVVEVATTGLPDVAGHVFHAAHPETVTVAQLVEKVLTHSGRPIPTRSFAADHALEILRSAGVTANQISMVAADNWLDSNRLWSKIAQAPGSAVDLDATTLSWYRSVLTA